MGIPPQRIFDGPMPDWQKQARLQEWREWLAKYKQEPRFRMVRIKPQLLKVPPDWASITADDVSRFLGGR